MYASHRTLRTVLESTTDTPASVWACAHAFAHTLAANTPFEYMVARRAVEKTLTATSKALGIPGLTAIHPFGFEPAVAAGYAAPLWIRRGFPAIGYPKTLLEQDRKLLGITYATKLFNIFGQDYSTYQRLLHFIEVHDGGHVFIPRANPRAACTIHIDMHPTDDILTHYSHGLIAALHQIALHDTQFPEIAEYDQALARRNRLGQYYFMWRAMAELLELPLESLTEYENTLQQALLNQLRFVNITELVADIPLEKTPTTPVELKIFNDLISPKLREIHTEVLKHYSKSAVTPLTASAYYSHIPNLSFTVEYPEAFIHDATQLFRQTYEEFPEKLATQTKKAAPSTSFAPR